MKKQTATKTTRVKKSVVKKAPTKALPKTVVEQVSSINFKKIHPLAKNPEKAHDNDAGFDIYAADFIHPSGEETGRYIEARTGICMEIPDGYVGFIFPRSSISKTKHYLRNSVGVIDAGYRGEIKLRFSYDDSSSSYGIGDKVGQVVFVKLPKISLKESFENLSDSERSSGGFGSTGL